MTAQLAVKPLGVELGIAIDAIFEGDPIYTEATRFPLGATDMLVQIDETEASSASRRPLGMRYGRSSGFAPAEMSWSPVVHPGPWQPDRIIYPGKDGGYEATLHETINHNTGPGGDSDVEQDYND
ncbi:hypothetical protein ACFQ71_38020 [Streptomyces sp. NPDC056534]|uniref:hypothetical protein n=1 Tax=Streptomyces sp. NPDC056534 TaxID=3345857 RepID=UPI0036ACBF67